MIIVIPLSSLRLVSTMMMNCVRNKRQNKTDKKKRTYVQELWTNKLTIKSHHQINRAKKIACAFTIKM